MRQVLLATIIGAFCASGALAQTTSPSPPSASAPASKGKVLAKARSAESIECSKQADAKGLHGKPRKAFRSKCMKDMHKKA
jgi:hypothetical protein